MSSELFGWKATEDPKEMALQMAYLFGLIHGQQARIVSLERRIKALESAKNE